MVNIELLKAKNEKEMTKVFNKYYKVIFKNILNIVKDEVIAEDLTSEAFMKAFSNIDKYVKNISFEMWLKTVANNHTIDYLRKTKKPLLNENLDDDSSYFQLEDSARNPYEELIRKENALVTNECIKNLIKIEKDLLELRYFKNLSYLEISKHLNVPIGTVKAYLHKAKKNLKELITNY